MLAVTACTFPWLGLVERFQRGSQIRERKDSGYLTGEAFHRWNKSDGWLVITVMQHADIWIIPTYASGSRPQ